MMEKIQSKNVNDGNEGYKQFSSKRKAAEYAIKEGIAEPLEAGAYRRLQLVGEELQDLIDEQEIPEKFREQLRVIFRQTSLSEIDARGLHESKKHAEDLASRDALTGLPNERAFMDELDARIKHADRFETDALYTIYIDIDKFKPINDVYGHGAGDRYLQLIAENVRKVFRPDDTFARLHGDEFAALLFLRNEQGIKDTDTDCDDEMLNITKRIREAVYHAKCDLRDELPTLVPGSPKLIVDENSGNASVGYARFITKEDTKESFLKKADEAMYKAKGESSWQR